MQRGNKLWEGHRMILPEHRAAMIVRDTPKRRPRALLEEAYEEMEYQLKDAIQARRSVTLVVGDDYGEQHLHGHVTGFRPDTGCLQVRSAHGRLQVPIDKVVRVL